MLSMVILKCVVTLRMSGRSTAQTVTLMGTSLAPPDAAATWILPV